MNGYRRRIVSAIEVLLSAIERPLSALDAGAGDGWIAAALEKRGILDAVRAVDVKACALSHHEVSLFDGIRLPFPNRAFDIVYAVDVVHHAS